LPEKSIEKKSREAPVPVCYVEAAPVNPCRKSGGACKPAILLGAAKVREIIG